MVNNKAIRVIGLIVGMKVVSYHDLALDLQHDEPCNDAAYERNTQVDKDAFGNLFHGDLHNASTETEERRKHSNEKPGVHTEKDDLKNAVERNQACAIFGVSFGQFVPHDHHRYTSGEADHYQPNHVFGRSGNRVIARKNIRIGPTIQF